ncbi:MAG: CDP-alcohol phosphatidyltransferase family protein [Phycisphaerales bacterium]
MSAHPSPPPTPPRSQAGAGAPPQRAHRRFVLAAVFVVLLSDARGPWIDADAAGLDQFTLLVDPETTRLVIATLVFLLAALTDTLDGQLARRWSVQSRLGRIMDPLADKVLVLGGFVLLAGPTFTATIAGERVQLSGVEPWMAIVILTRELLVTSIRGMYEAEGFDFSAALSGKLKMVVQSVAIPAILAITALGSPVPGSAPRLWVLALAWTTTAVTALSAWPYLWKAYLASTGRIKPKPPNVPRPEPDLGRVQGRVEIPATHTRKKRSSRSTTTKPGRRPTKRSGGTSEGGGS